MLYLYVTQVIINFLPAAYLWKVHFKSHVYHLLYFQPVNTFINRRSDHNRISGRPFFTAAVFILWDPSTEI